MGLNHFSPFSDNFYYFTFKTALNYFGIICTILDNYRKYMRLCLFTLASEIAFLDATSHLALFVRPSVGWSVGPSVGNAYVKIEIGL